MEHLRVCEFYSGLGGYHLALKALPFPFTVVAAYEISGNANLIYRHNFPQTRVFEKNLCGVTAEDLDVLQANMFVMSPPCQPYTRQGKKKDSEDHRADSVIHLFNIFSQLKTPPEYFFVENVKGFEVSKTREHLMSFFEREGYNILEYLLNPNQLNIPNSRLRYYLLARKQKFRSGPTSQIRTSLELPATQSPPVEPVISNYLTSPQPGLYEISDKFLSKWGRLLDIVRPDSTRSCCFTKGYSVKAEGSGSVLQQQEHEPSATSLDPQHNSSSLTDSELTGDEFLAHMKALNLRFFTPREIARLHGVPEWFQFPKELSDKQLYRLLGNGLNVTVVQLLMRHVLFEE